MIRSVDMSIDKTFARMPQFEDDHEKSTEIFSALSELHSIKKNLTELRDSIPNPGYENGNDSKSTGQ